MKKKVLVIDDELTMRTLLEFFLGSKYEVASAESAVEALSWLDHNLPDLIISDIQMPGIDGFEFLKTVRKRGYTRNIPIVMLSGKSESKETCEMLSVGSSGLFDQTLQSRRVG